IYATTRIFLCVGSRVGSPAYTNQALLYPCTHTFTILPELYISYGPFQIYRCIIYGTKHMYTTTRIFSYISSQVVMGPKLKPPTRLLSTHVNTFSPFTLNYTGSTPIVTNNNTISQK